MIQELKAWAQALSSMVYLLSIAAFVGALIGVVFFFAKTIANLAPG